MSSVVYDYSIFNADPNIIYAAGRDTSTTALFKTEDGGGTWETFTFPEMNVSGYIISVDPCDADRAYACGYDNNEGNSECVLVRTADGGDNWEEIWRDSLRAFVSDIKVDSMSGNRIYAGTSEGVYISEDYGDNWIEPVDSLRIYHIKINPHANNIVYGGGPDGLHMSVDYGASWTSIDSTLGHTHISSLEYDPLNDKLFAGTWGAGIYKASTLTDIDGDNSSLPSKVFLLTNYPNPFNPSTRIEFSIPESGKAKIEIFDLMGRRVATLVDGKLEAGRHHLVWNAEGIASGIYFCRLSSGDDTIVRKMGILK
ncbi:MAG: T9SS type A sorting domain-containing protein [candidate division Zixibacteria bacterium]|nr:T9SS type A sorting domain-containing protein [candidate division Zixibacteria bacterium]